MKQKSTPNSLPNINEETERLNFALQAAGIGTWTLDPKTNKIIWDERCCELYGFAWQESISYDDLFLHIHPDEQQIVKDAVAQSLDPINKTPYEVRFRSIGANQQMRWLYCRGKSYFNDAGDLVRFSGTAQDITEVIESREQIAAAEQRAQMALEGSNAGSFTILMANDTLEYSNRFAYIFTGNEQARLNRAGFLKHVHPDDLKHRNDAYKAAAVTGSLDYKSRVIWNDGSIHWMHATGSYLFDTAGKPYLFSGTVRDITPEVEARHQAERFNTLIAASHDWMGIVSIDGRCEFINTSGLALIGQDAKNGPDNLSFFDVFMPSSAKLIKEVAWPLVLANGHWEDRVEFRHFKRKKVIIPVFLKITLQRDEHGNAQSVFAVGRDLRSEEAALSALRENEALFRNVTNSAPTGLWLSEENGGLVYLNQILMEWTGMPYKDLLGVGWTYAIIDEDRQKSIDAFQEAMATKSHYDVLFRIKKGDGKIIWCRSAGDPYFHANGAFAGYAGFCMDIDEQVKNANAYQESESRFRSIVEQAPLAIGLLGGREMIVEVGNNKLFELWGKTRAVTGLSVVQALPEIVGQPFLSLLEQVYDTGEPYFGNGVLARLERNGIIKDIYFDFTYMPLRSASGDITGVMVLATEVTAQVLARKKIEESEERFRALIAAAPTGIAVFMGRDLVIENPNQTFLDLVGKDQSIIGKNLQDAMPELNGQPFLQILDDVYTTGKSFQTFDTQVFLEKNGVLTPGFYDFSYTPLLDAAGNTYGILDISVDVTDQVLARQKLVATEAALRDAIELAELATWTMDFKTGELTYSTRLMSWFGFKEGETVYTAHYNPVHERFRAQINDAIAEAMKPENGGMFDTEVLVVEYKTGGERIIHAQGRTIFDDQGHPVTLSGTAQDVTEQRQIQLALERQVQERTEELQTVNEELKATNEELNESNNQLTHSNEELAQYAYVASHDLQEPLRKIRMFSGMLGKSDLSDQNKTLVQKINQSSERMTMLIRDLLDFSRLLKTDALMRPVDLTKVVEAVSNDFELSILEKNARVEIGKLPVIEAVSLQMNQLFYNLLSNALKFTDPFVSPRIIVDAVSITMEEVSRYIPKPLLFSNYYRITFTDNGIGFEVKYSEQIFEVFKRLHGRELYPGSGIGLALCRRIAGNHNGYLYAESTPGKGTSFHILLPDRQHNYQASLPEHFTWANEPNQQN